MNIYLCHSVMSEDIGLLSGRATLALKGPDSHCAVNETPRLGTMYVI